MKLKLKILKFLLIIFLLSFFSCNIEKQLATKFVDSSNQISLLILEPDVLFKENLKTDEIPNYELLDTNQRDSLLLLKSKFLQHVNDSAFLSNYSISLENELKKYGFKVYTSSMLESFLLIDTLAYIFDISQIELEEYLYTKRKSERFNYELYYKDFDLNAVALNAWIDFKKLNDNKNSTEVLFCNHFVSDKISGKFKKYALLDSAKFVYKRRNMLIGRVNNLSIYAGRKHAAYIFDYLMNDFIDIELNGVHRETEYFHYDPLNNILEPAGDKKFILMK